MSKIKSQKSKTLFLDKNNIHTIIPVCRGDIQGRQSLNHSKCRTLVWLYGSMQFVSIKFLLFFIFSLFLSACDKGPPIAEEKFIKVYVDFLIIQDTSVTNPVSIDSIRNIVFFKNDLTSEQYDKTIEYYNSRPEKWEAFFDSVTAYVERLRKTEN